MEGYGLDFSLRSLRRFNRSSLTFLPALVCALEILFSSSKSDAMGFFTYSSISIGQLFALYLSNIDKHLVANATLSRYTIETRENTITWTLHYV